MSDITCMIHALFFTHKYIESRARIVICHNRKHRWPIKPYLFSSVTNAFLLLQIYNDITIILQRHNTMATQCFSNRSIAINLLSNLY